METYAKLLGGAIRYAPKKLSLNGMTVVNPTTKQYAEAGWMLLVRTDPPYENGKVATPYYTEQDGRIVQGWILRPIDVDLPALKSERIANSKAALAEYIESHPLMWTDGKSYTVTAEKQALLNNALAVYQLSVAAGQPSELSWNATGEECVTWEYDELCALALAIAAYVKPLVSKQQAIEVAINAAETAEEVNAIEIGYP